jgi:hypothetical protein
MKKTFFRILPLVAAVMLAASCGKDGDSDVNINAPEPVVTPDPTQTPVGDGFVEIPFSIKVNDGNSLSKVSLSYDEDKKKAINFDPSDVWDKDKNTGVQLTVTGSGVSGTLNLVKPDGYKFEGTLQVEDASAFTTGIDLVGTFTLNESSITTSSATSFKDLWDNCAHEFKAEFKSNDGELTLVDQNFYIYVATFKNAIKIGEITVTDGNFTKGTYYVFPISTSVTDNGSAKSIAPSKLYTIGEYVDLGVEVGGKKILFAKDNTYDAKAWSALSEDEQKLLPTKEEWKALKEQCTWTWDGTEGHKGYTVSSKSTGQSVFLPVTPGHSSGFYWSSTEYDADGAYCLYLSSSYVDPEGYSDKSGTWSVRSVRRSN